MLKKFDSINFIPFIDIMLVLLAIVLTTSTFINKGMLPVELPSSELKEKIEPKSIVITITQKGEIFLEKEPISLLAMKSYFDGKNRQQMISINCDKRVAFNHFVRVMEMLKSLEFHNISILTEL